MELIIPLTFCIEFKNTILIKALKAFSFINLKFYRKKARARPPPESENSTE